VRFWDSSAIVPLVVEQPTSKAVERWLSADAVLVVWTLTVVEVTSALRRLVRERAMSERAAVEAERLASDVVRHAHVVTDIEQTKLLARRVLRIHPLRSADALQLAAALAWANGRPAGHTFHTFDQRLGQSAEREGFEVPPHP